MTQKSERFSPEQKQIALSLVAGPLTPEEIKQKTTLSLDRITIGLKELMTLKLVEKKNGFPTRYVLLPDITQEVLRRKAIGETDSNPIQLRAIIEGQAFEPELLNKQMNKLSEALSKETDFMLYHFTLAPTLKQEEMYSTFLDVTLSVKDFKAVVRFMFFYGPATLEILKPSKLEISAHDLQEGLLDMAQMIHKYSDYLAKLLNRTELEEFNRRLSK